MREIHGYHIGTAAIGLLLVVFLFMSRKFMAEALSETGSDGKTSPSSKRVIAFLLCLAVIMCEGFHTLKQQKFDYQHLVALLITMSLYSGIATVGQLMSIWKGRSTESTTASSIERVTQTEVKSEVKT